MVENSLRIGGAVTFWTLGEMTSRAMLKEGMEAAGFGKQVPESRPAAGALKDALQQVVGGPTTLIRPLKAKDGFCVIQEERGDQVNRYQPSLVARIDPGTLEISFSPYDERAQPIVDAFNAHLGILRGAQVSAGLVAVLDLLGGTRLRPTGAIYWLPEPRLRQWEAVAQAVEQAGMGRPNSVYILRHQLDEDAIRAVRDAIVAEVAGEAQRIDQEVSSGELGERALDHRKEQAEALRSKIRQYEDILGIGLQSLHEAVDQAEQAACKASILAATVGLQQQEVAHVA
jgi:hypothetical protein